MINGRRKTYTREKYTRWRFRNESGDWRSARQFKLERIGAPVVVVVGHATKRISQSSGMEDDAVESLERDERNVVNADKKNMKKKC